MFGTTLNALLLLRTRKNKRLRELREMEEFELHHWLSFPLLIHDFTSSVSDHWFDFQPQKNTKETEHISGFCFRPLVEICFLMLCMRLNDCNCYNYEESGMLMHPPGLTWCGSEDGRLRSCAHNLAVLLGSGDSKLFSGLSIFGKLAIVYYSFLTVICALIFHVWYDTERLAPATNEEEQAVERVEGNGGVRAPSLVVGGLKDGDEASLERIHHLGPTENGQIDFKEM
ncbi:hypothetical protein DY000_02005780 [Brassica cretica]|uniref:EF-hand domain-containing protein n=1 Tax=Brassica cretica TaxID=69181 RepID=A0ABQ7CAZ6_BRACR|nr:hypothetical protein DY000_02005780 [Brassica cretica]